ncbi:MAG: DUF4238 domain-containing protein [bacterium]|nr:DUF4238 domain-containing protein [bacterium]
MIYPTSVNNATVISNFYSNPHLDDPVKEEKRISKIESDVAPVYKEVMEKCIAPEGKKKEILLAFIANLYNRTLWSRRLSKAIFYDLARNAGNPKNEWHEMAYGKIFGETVNIESRLVLSEIMKYARSEFGDSELNIVEEGEYLANLMRLHWRVEVAPEGSNFICSDAPVFRFRGQTSCRPFNLSIGEDFARSGVIVPFYRNPHPRGHIQTGRNIEGPFLVWPHFFFDHL